MVTAPKKRAIIGKGERYYPLYPDYPQSGLMAFLFLMADDRPQGILHLSSIYPDMEYVKKAMPPSVEFFIKRGEKDGVSVADQGLLIPLKLSKTLSLKAGYWSNAPPLDCRNYLFRLQAFLPVATDPEAFDLLVLPTDYHPKEGWLYSAAMPFTKGTDMKVIETFLAQSNYPVFPKAKVSALYARGKPLGFDWRTGEPERLN